MSEKLTHVGIAAHRLPHGDLERAFSELWAAENADCHILQLLMYERGAPLMPFDTGKPRYVITQRDADIAATVIQWLGSNIGYEFLGRALDRVGRKIVSTDPKRYSIHSYANPFKGIIPDPSTDAAARTT